MNVQSFFQHHGIRENPFQAEEARHDAVFARVEGVCHHPDYPKIRGDFERPATAIVFGERGSGKTAIRLQIEDDINEHNQQHPEARCLLIAYDDLNPVLDRLHRHGGGGSIDDVLSKVRLVDHIDGVLATAVPRIVDQAFGESREDDLLRSDTHLLKSLRQYDQAARRDLLLLQLCYDRPDEADLRTARLRHAMRSSSRPLLHMLKWSGLVGLVLTLALLLYVLIANPEELRWLWIGAVFLIGAITAVIGGRYAWMWLKLDGIARRLAASLRVLDRQRMSFRKSLASLRTADVLSSDLPQGDADDARYGMLNRLLRIIRPLGYRAIIVLVDRVDEPTLINGEPQRMRSLIWPMLNNKFLQQDRIAVKMLLPLELKHMLFRESTQFFREARLDKQNLVERLTWSGATLYDVCTARLNACRGSRDEDQPAAAISLTDLFDDTVSHQDLVDALNQMQQPRDAFKFLYQVIHEHCTALPDETPQWQIPKLTLDNVRKREVERLSTMLRGERPA